MSGRSNHRCHQIVHWYQDCNYNMCMERSTIQAATTVYCSNTETGKKRKRGSLEVFKWAPVGQEQLSSIPSKLQLLWLWYFGSYISLKLDWPSHTWPWTMTELPFKFLFFLCFDAWFKSWCPRNDSSLPLWYHQLPLVFSAPWNTTYYLVRSGVCWVSWDEAIHEAVKGANESWNTEWLPFA